MKGFNRLISIFVLSFTCSCFALIVEAEEAAIQSAGGPISGGLNLFSNGFLGDYIDLRDSGNYKIIVRAYGTPLANTWPFMTLLVDGVTFETRIVNSNEFAEYSFNINTTKGIHSICISFSNDAFDPESGEDLNLYLDSIEIYPLQEQPNPILSTADSWGIGARAREDDVIIKSEEAINQNRKGSGVIAVLDSIGNPISDISLIIELVDHDFLFGCNIYEFDKFKTEEENKIYKFRFKELFNFATIPFYWRYFEFKQGNPDYNFRDKIVEWCMENGIRMKGHALLYGHVSGIPTWSNGQPSPDLQKNHVTEIMNTYKDNILFWEVVNEPFHYPELSIDEPYLWAQGISPKDYLIINDYWIFADGFIPFFEFLKEKKNKMIPYSGIGIQAHAPQDMAFPLSQVQTILDRYAILDKDLYITEFTPCSNGNLVTGSPWRGHWDEIQQADYAEKFYRICFAHPAVKGITWWDLSDQYSWLKDGGLLRADLSPKPAFEALNKLINMEWHTLVEGKTDESGNLQFNGFYGLYNIIINHERIENEVVFQLKKGNPNNLTIIVSDLGISPPKNFRIIRTEN